MAPQGQPELVRVHDFKDKQLGKAIPYGVYDIAGSGVGERRDRSRHRPVRGRIDPQLVGAPRPGALPGRAPPADHCRLRRLQRQPDEAVEGRAAEASDETELEIEVCHFPPGTSKWNQIEHRLFSFITMNWRGKPLVSLETIINLIAGTTNSTGLEVYARLDQGAYPDKITVTNAEFKTHQLTAGQSSIPSGTTSSSHNINYEQALTAVSAATNRSPSRARCIGSPFRSPRWADAAALLPATATCGSS